MRLVSFIFLHSAMMTLRQILQDESSTVASCRVGNALLRSEILLVELGGSIDSIEDLHPLRPDFCGPQHMLYLGLRVFSSATLYAKVRGIN